MRVEATQNAPKPKERDAVKKMAVEFLTKLDANNLLVGHWREMAATQAKLPLEIENHLLANNLSGVGYPRTTSPARCRLCSPICSPLVLAIRNVYCTR